MGLVPLESYVSPLSLSTHGFLDKTILEVANLRKVSRDCKKPQIWDPGSRILDFRVGRIRAGTYIQNEKSIQIVYSNVCNATSEERSLQLWW